MIIITVVSVDIFGRIRQWRFNEDVSEFAQMLHLGAEHAVYANRTYVAVIRISGNSYAIYPTNAGQKFERGLRPLLEPQRLRYCDFEEITFDDGTNQFSGDVLIYISPKGFEASVLFRLQDNDNRRRFVRCDKFTTRVRNDNKSLDLIAPRINLTIYSSL